MFIGTILVMAWLGGEHVMFSAACTATVLNFIHAAAYDKDTQDLGYSSNPTESDGLLSTSDQELSNFAENCASI